MSDSNDQCLQLYDILNKRIEHLEKAKLQIVVAAIALTAIVFKKDFYADTMDNLEIIGLYFPFAILAIVHYSISLRVVTIAKDLKLLELDSSCCINKFGIKYFSSVSPARALTYTYFVSQFTSAFLFVPALKFYQKGACQYGLYSTIIVSIIIILFFTILVRNEVKIQSKPTDIT
jgi:hypothetical protein